MTSSASDQATIVDVMTPQMGTSVVEATVVEWMVAVGDSVAVDDVICEVSSDKIDVECPSPISGVVAEILVETGTTVDIPTVLARISTGEPAGSSSTVTTPPASEQSVAATEVGVSSETAESAAGADSPQSPAGWVSPVARRIASEHGINLDTVLGTGHNERITKRDVLKAIEEGPREPMLHSESPYRPEPAPGAVTGHVAPSPAAVPDDLGGESVQLSRMRQSIGSAMSESLQIAATCTTVVECDMSQVDLVRKDAGVTALPVVARSVIDVLRDFPDLNAHLDGTTMTRFDRVHLGIAVSLGDDGLIVPVIHDAQTLSVQGLGQRIKDLARRARSKQLSADDLQGATFTITNPGASGALMATPVISQPQVAILDLEAIVRRPVVVADELGQESIAIRPMVNFCMSWDHRALDGVYAAQFLTALRGRLEARG